MYASVVAIAIQIIVSLLLVLWTRAKVRKSMDSGDEMERVRRELGALMMELEGTADRNVTILEDRISSMRELLAEADRRIALMSREGGRRKAEEGVRQRARAEAPPAADPTQAEASPLAEPPSRIETPSLFETRRRDEAEPQRPAREENIPFIKFADKPISIEAPFAEKVMELYRRGFSSDIIAARLGSTMSEVDLALAVSGGMDRRRDGV